MINATISNNTKRLVISGTSSRLMRNDELHESISGEKMRAPKPSPIHHVSHSGVRAALGLGSPNQTLRLPIVALTSGARTAAYTTNVSTSPTELKEFLQRFDLFRRNQAANASSVFPVAMPNVKGIGRLVGKFAASAPRKTPGRTRGPKMSTAAIAIPVGGQTGVTFSWSDASESPSSAPAK